MNGDRGLMRLAGILDELAGSGRTDYAAAIVVRAATVQQRPAWRFASRWLPPGLLAAFRSARTAPPARAFAFVLLALLVGALILALVIGSRRNLPAPFGPAGNGVLAFASEGQIYVARSPRDQPSVLIDGPESDNIPIFSPRGDRVSFLRHPDPTGTEGDFFLMVADADGSNIRSLGGPISGLNGIAWSPDETSIAFGHSVQSVSAVVLYPIDGGASRVLDLDVPAEWPAWRPPDGRQLAFVGLVDGRWTLHVGLLSGAVVRNLGLGAAVPAWSPDGRRIVFDALDTSDDEETPSFVHVADIGEDGMLVSDRALRFDAANDMEGGAAWSPDGRQLAFVRGRDDRYVVAVGNADGTDYREIGIETGPADARFASVWAWSPDGRWVIQTFDDGATWIFDPAGGTPQRAAVDVAAFTNWQRVAP
jgi:Tol biopolymer transport system component